MFHVKHCVRKFRLKKWSCVFRWYKGFLIVFYPMENLYPYPIYGLKTPFTNFLYHLLTLFPTFYHKNPFFGLKSPQNIYVLI